MERFDIKYNTIIIISRDDLLPSDKGEVLEHILMPAQNLFHWILIYFRIVSFYNLQFKTRLQGNIYNNTLTTLTIIVNCWINKRIHSHNNVNLILEISVSFLCFIDS